MLKIGNLEINPPLVLGPMAGYTSLPFRLLCHNAGAGLVVSEMISAKALQYGSTKTPPLMATIPACSPSRVPTRSPAIPWNMSSRLLFTSTVPLPPFRRSP